MTRPSLPPPTPGRAAGVLLLQGVVFWSCALAGTLLWMVSGQWWPWLASAEVLPWVNGLLVGLAAGVSVVLALVQLGWSWKAIGGWGWELRSWLQGVGTSVLAWGLISGLLAALGGLERGRTLPAPAWTLAGVAAALLLSAWGEEVVFRGLWFSVLRSHLSFPLAALGSTLAFTLLHMSNPGWSWRGGVGVFLAGWLLALARERTQGLAWPVGFHWGWNVMQGLVLGFPVSGLPLPSWLGLDANGPLWWTGGDFGPEAGVAAWTVLFLLLVTLRIWPRHATHPHKEGRT